MVIAVFRSRVRPDRLEEYLEVAVQMREIAEAMPGFVSYKAFTADDGERVSIHEWDTPEHLRAWREHPKHEAMQEVGRHEYYEEYTLYVAENPRESRFTR